MSNPGLTHRSLDRQSSRAGSGLKRPRRWLGVGLTAVLLIGSLWLATLTTRAQRPEPAAIQTGELPPAALTRYAPAWQQPVTRQPVLPASQPEGVDLEVTFISRSPTYHRYCVIYPQNKPILCPGTEQEQRWPGFGDTVTFTGHIANQGTEPSPPFTYIWAIDDLVVASGSLPALAPQQTTTVIYQWVWQHQSVGERLLSDHTVTLTVDPDNLIPETHITNNSIRDYTGAMSLKIGITPEMIAAYRLPAAPQFPYSAENWLQRQIEAMNWGLANAVYPLTPDGAAMRVRLDSIEVRQSPPPVDRRHDGYWFVDADYRTFSGGYDPVTDIDWNLVHELSHQIGLIDLYNYNIFDSRNQVRDQHGLPINFSFYWARPGLMGGGDIAPYTEWYRYSSHSAAGTTATAGYRRGYYGEYQYALPVEVVIEVLDNSGEPAAEVEVRLYQRTGPADWIGDISIDNVPEISGVTGADGRFILPNRSVYGEITTATGHTLRDNPFGLIDVVGPRNRFLVNLRRDGHEAFHWLDLTQLNMAYWSGQTDSVVLTFDVGFGAAAAPAAPQISNTEVRFTDQTVCWTHPEPATVAGYHVYRIRPPEFDSYEQVATLLPGPCYTHSGVWEYAVYAVTAVDSDGRESGFSPLVWQPILPLPTSVTSRGPNRLSDGRVIVVDRHSGRIIEQRPDGRFLQPLTSPHLGLVGVEHIASDGQRRTYYAHPHHYVQVLTQSHNPLFAIGQPGSAPGQFQTPTGIAASSAAYAHPTCHYGGPYDLDDDTLLLLHFDGHFDGAAGEIGTSIGVTLTDGLHGQAALFAGNSRLIYDTAGNIDRQSGAIEFWFRPNWQGNDFQSYVLFEAGNTWFNRLRIAKDGANNLRFMVWDNQTEFGAAYNVNHWVAGQWYHIAATWRAGQGIQLFVDGALRSSDQAAAVPATLPATMTIGAANFEPWRAEGSIDELRISGWPRVGNSDICQPTLFIADSGNDRLQAFDGSGNYLAHIGGFGSAPGQFNNPQGVAIRPNREIVVVDSGNNRLQVLTFNGGQFTVERTIEADLNAPTHIAVHGDDYLVVADTGHNAVKLLWQETLSATYTMPNDGSGLPFSQPLGVVALPDGTLVVADQGHGRLVRMPGVLPPLTIHYLYMPLMARP